MAKIQDPRATSLQTLLSGIYGKTVEVQPTPKFEPTAVKACALAMYVDNQDQMVGMLVCSLAAAGYLGAALSLLPKPVADESIRKGALDEGLLENFQEVANICSSLFTEHVGTRVHLKTVVPKVAAMPAEHKAFLQTAVRTDVIIDVPSYGPGPVSIRIGKSAAA
jgi:hypothetical protein